MKCFKLVILTFLLSLGLVACSSSQDNHLFKVWSDKEWGLALEEQKHRYHFQQLNDEEKENYLRMADALRQFDKKIYLEMTDEASLYKTYNALTNDNPDIFWIEGMEVEEVDEETLLMRVQQPDKVKKTYQELQTVADEIVSQMPDGSDYDKVKYLYEYIIFNTDYDLKASYNQDIRSVLLNHVSVCTGYAKTFQFLAEKAGIETLFVAGNIEGVTDYGHAWNMVKIGSNYYWVDATWGDPVFEKTFELADTSLLPNINYRFLCTSDHYFFKTHTPETRTMVHLGYIDTLSDDEIWTYPSATDDGLLYTRLNGGYFESYDRSAIASYLETKLADASLNKIEFQFLNETVYQEAKQDLLDQNALGELIALYWPSAGEFFNYYTIEEPNMNSFSLILPQ